MGWRAMAGGLSRGAPLGKLGEFSGPPLRDGREMSRGVPRPRAFGRPLASSFASCVADLSIGAADDQLAGRARALGLAPALRAAAAALVSGPRTRARG